MPTIRRIGAYRLFFYAGDRDELEHIHVERDENVAKFWLDPVRLAGCGKRGSAEGRSPFAGSLR
ncbi:MAG: DUF4160 domain-containing protein, partial [Chloroflexi bacterium]|nr:DUF4160 domain-containing protein [Chloroflexota bacterium]